MQIKIEHLDAESAWQRIIRAHVPKNTENCDAQTKKSAQIGGLF